MAAVWSGRVLIALTIVVVVLTRWAHSWWERSGWDASGYPRHWLPILMLTLVFAVSVSALWLCGLAASPRAARRDGQSLLVTTVMGRRRLVVETCRALPFRVIGMPATVHGAVVLGSPGMIVILAEGIPNGGRTRIAGLLDRTPRSGAGRILIEHLIGLLGLVVAAAVALAVVALALWVSGTGSRGA